MSCKLGSWQLIEAERGPSKYLLNKFDTVTTSVFIKVEEKEEGRFFLSVFLVQNQALLSAPKRSEAVLKATHLETS